MSRNSVFRKRIRAACLQMICGTSIVVYSTGAIAGPPKVDFNGVWMRGPQRGPEANPRTVNPKMSPPPLKEPYAKDYAERQALRRAAEERGQPFQNAKGECLPDGMPVMMETSLPIEILQSHDKMTQIIEFGTQVRHIYIGASNHPGEDELEFNFFGDSIAKWEGKALVVDTIGIRKATLLFNEVPHGEQLRIVERYTLLDPNLLEVQMTLEDPEYFSGPWNATFRYVRQPDMRLREFVCQENQRHYTDENGHIGTIYKQ